MNILVVDDEPIITMGIVKRIRSMKDLYVQAVGAHSAENALEIMEDFIPDLLVTDIQMPRMNGFSLLSKIRDEGICHNYIILTAHQDFEYARQAVRCRVVDYLIKPIDWSLLESHIRDLAMQSDKKTKLERIFLEFPVVCEDVSTDILSHSLCKIVNYIKANYTKEISLTHLAIFSGVSENYICNLFKKELDQTFLDFVYKLRIRKAMELLITDNGKNLREISAMLGYRSERQLFRLFKSKLGMTPQQFKEAYFV